MFILSDPAPHLQGGFKGLTEKQRGDGTKDHWSICAIKIRPRGEALDRILLDGVRSQEWSHQEGADEAARLMKKWRSNLFFSEAQNEHHKYMKQACLALGIGLRRSKQNGPLKFDNYNKSDRKNASFNELAGVARLQEFWISETCPDEFLYGDKEHTGFLTQARKWIKLKEGSNTLRYDDDADVVARCMDTALLEFSPHAQFKDRGNPWGDDDDDDSGDDGGYQSRSRYCGA